MPFSGWKALAAGIPVADMPGSVNFYQALASSRKWCADELTPRFTHIFHDEDTEPNSGPKAGNSPPFQRPKLCSLEWRCLPFLWRFTPMAKEFTVLLIGDLEDAKMEFDLQLYPGRTPVNRTPIATGTATEIEMTIDVPRPYRGTVQIVLLFYRSRADLSATLQTGYAYTGTTDYGYWWAPITASPVAGQLCFVRNCDDTYPSDPAKATDEVVWPGSPDWVPSQLIQFTDRTYANNFGSPRQLVHIEEDDGNGGFAYFIDPPDLSTPLGIPFRGIIGWETYALGVLKVASLAVYESA